MCKSKYTWNFLETSKEDENAYRFIKDERLNWINKNDNYSWTSADAKIDPAASWKYNTNMMLIKYEDEISIGTGLMLNSSIYDAPAKIFFLINPFDQKYWFGTYNLQTKAWSTLNAYTNSNFNIFF